jgi:hypothetical protein
MGRGVSGARCCRGCCWPTWLLLVWDGKLPRWLVVLELEVPEAWLFCFLFLDSPWTLCVFGKAVNNLKQGRTTVDKAGLGWFGLSYGMEGKQDGHSPA